VRPNSVTRKKDLAMTRNGDIITGTADDVSVLQAQKQYDLQVVEKSIAKLEERMSYAFLLHTAIQRDAERVTAAEVTMMANELENSLGGIYSILTQEFQLPYLRRRMHMLVRSGKAPKLPEKLVKPKIVTGVQGLGRGNDRNKLVEFIGTVSQALGPDIMRQYMNVDEAIKRLANSIGIDTANLVKTQEEIQAEMQAMQQQQLIQHLGPAALGSPLLDPKNNAQAQQVTEETNANEEA